MSGSIEHYVDWYEIDPSKISIGSPETKTPKVDTNGKQSAPYATANLHYLYKLPNGAEVKDTLAIQLCEVKVYGLLLPKAGFKDTQIKAIFPKDKAEVKACMQKMDEVHAKIVDLICQPGIKGNLKAEKVIPEFAKLKGVGVNKLISYPTDKLTSEFDFTKNPFNYFKLVAYESTKSKFSIIDEKGEIKILEWKEIENAEFSGKPVINYRSLYSNGNGNVSPQSPVASFAIFDIKYKGSGNPQADELKKQAERNPDMVKNVTAGYKELIEKMAASKCVATPEKKAELQSASTSTQQQSNQNNTQQQSNQNNTQQHYAQNAQNTQNAGTSQQPSNLQNFMRGPIPGQQFYGNINAEQQQAFNMPPGSQQASENKTSTPVQSNFQMPPGFNVNM